MAEYPVDERGHATRKSINESVSILPVFLAQSFKTFFHRFFQSVKPTVDGAQFGAHLVHFNNQVGYYFGQVAWVHVEEYQLIYPAKVPFKAQVAAQELAAGRE